MGNSNACTSEKSRPTQRGQDLRQLAGRGSLWHHRGMNAIRNVLSSACRAISFGFETIGYAGDLSAVPRLRCLDLSVPRAPWQAHAHDPRVEGLDCGIECDEFTRGRGSG